ncbi:MAG: GNAT family N-acetyltransferase [bacterium]
MAFLPAPSPVLPAPAPLFPTFAPVPLFGLTNDERQLGAALGNPPVLMGAQTATGAAPDAVAAGGRTAAPMSFLEKLTGGALGAGSDPATWTPETAAAQTDAALAKIAQVNPELAQSIAAQHGKSEGEDLPWYKDIMKGVGDVLHATKLDVVFDIMGRASHVLPEIVHDWGKESVWKNTSDALLGKSDTNWADVLTDNMGMGRNFFTAAAGFIGDIATDPLTWLTFGAGAIGREVIGKTVGEASVVAAMKEGSIQVTERTSAALAEKGVQVAAGETADIGQLMKVVGDQLGTKDVNEIGRAVFGLSSPGQALAEKGSTGILSRVRQALTGVHPDAVPNVAFVLDQEGTRVAAQELLRLGDDMFREATTNGWQRVTAETADKLGVSKSAVDDVLRGYVKAGTGIGVDKASYTAGKAAAGAFGGVRLRMSIPLLDIRVAGQRMPFAASFMDFSMGRRFFSGLSGGVKLSRLVGQGAATAEDLHIFWEKGFSGLRTLSNSAAARDMAKGPRSIYYSASEQVGKLTEHFSSHAAVLRGGGLPAAYARDANLQLKHMRQQVIDEVQTVTLSDGKTVLTPDQSIGRVVKASKAAGDAGGLTSQIELTDALNEYRSLVPEPGTKAKDYYDRLIADAQLQATQRGEDPTQAIADLEKDRATAQRVEQRIVELGHDEDLPDLWRTMAHQHDQALVNSGLAPDHVQLGADGETLADREHVRPEDAKAHSFDGHEYETPMVTVSQGPNDVEALTDVVDLGDGTTLPIRGLAAKQVGPIGENVPVGASARYGPVDTADRMAAPPAPGVLMGPVEASGTIDAPRRFYRGHVPGKEANDSTKEWFKNVFGSHDRTVAEDYAKLPGGSVEAYDIQPGAKVLVEGTPEFDAVMAAGKEAKEVGGTGRHANYYDRLTREAKAQGYDVIQMKDQAGEGTAVLNPQVLKKAEEVPAAGTRSAQDRVQQLLNGSGPEDDLAAGVQAQVVTLTGPEASYIAQPRLAGLGPQNLLDVDYSPVVAGAGREASGVVNRIAEIQDAYAPVLDDIAAGTYQFGEDVSPEAAEAVRDVMRRGGAKEQQLADITTEILKSDGYTGVRIKGADGKVTVVGFYDDKTGTTMFSRVNPRAAALSPNRGSQLRAVTIGAKEAVLGTNRAEGTDLIQSILREARDMPRPQAEALAKDRLAAKGVVLREGQSFFETDPVAVLKETSTQVSNKVVAQHAGDTLRMAESLGLARGGFGQSAAGFGRYRVVISPESLDAMESMSEEAKVAATRAARLLDDRKVPELRLKVQHLGQSYLEEQRAYADLVDNAGARELGIINNIKRDLADKEDAGVDTGLEHAEQTGGLERAQQDFDRLRDLDNSGMAVVGTGKLGRIIKRAHADGTETFYYIDDEGKVLGYRKVDSGFLSAERRYGPDYNLSERRMQLERNVVAITAPEWQGKGIGRELLNAHWADMNVTDLDEVATVTAAQSLSTAGAKLNIGAVKEWTNKFKRTAQKRANAVKGEAEKAQRELRLREVELTEATNEAGRLATRMQTQRAPVLAALVPAEDAANRTGMAVLRIPGFEQFAMPEVMANEFEMAMKGFPKLDGAHGQWRQFNGWWKSMATWLMPGFHLRNFQGAFFNNWLGGVSIKDYWTAGRIRMAERELTHGKEAKWATEAIMKRDPEFIAGLRRGIPGGTLMGKKVEDLTYADMASLGAALNTTASNGRMFAEAALTAEKAEKKYAGKSGTMGALPIYAKGMRGAGTMTENVFRTASLVRGMREGRGVMEARAFTMVRHGDYEDLTDWEYGWVRDVLPFYKWMRTNTPFQIHQLLENPAKLLAMQKAQRSVFDARGLDFDKEKYRAPDWMMQSFVIPTSVGKDGTYDTMMLDLPMSDLFMSGREFISSFLPTVSPFLQSYVLHQNIYTGAPITGKQVPMNPLFNIIEPLLDATGLTSRGPDGKAYMSDKTQNLLGTIPIYSRFKNFLTEDPARVTNRQHVLTSALFGLGGYKVDEAALSSTELDFYYSTIVPTMEYLKQVGYPLPTKDDLTSTIGSIDGILTGLGITPGPVQPAAAAA